MAFRILRLGLLLVLALITLSLVIALGSAETGPIEKGVLAVGIIGLIAAAAPVRRIGASH